MCQPGRPGPSGAVPERLAVLGRFPQDEIAGVGFVVFVHVDARAGADAAEIVVRELAVVGKLRDAVVDRAVAAIGVAALVELLDGVDHFVDVLGGLHHALRPLQAQRRAVFEESLRVDRGVFGDAICARPRRCG